MVESPLPVSQSGNALSATDGYGDLVALLEHGPRSGISLGLERTKELLRVLGDPHLGLKGALVAGTNGKGSVCATLAAACRAAGLKEALLTKPHLQSWTERIVANGYAVSEAEFARLGRVVLDAASRLAPDLYPTSFEILTAMGLLAAREAEANVTICEVGLGGRLDSTNVFDPGVCVITNVSLDHTDLLGDTVEEIAAEKAAIVKSAGTVITGATEPALSVIRERCQDKGAELILVSGSDWEENGVASATEILLQHPSGPPLRLCTPLLGTFQAENLAVAAVTARVMGIPDDAIVRGASATSWPGRLQVLDGKPTFVLDGAHNAAGMAALGQSIRNIAGDRRIVAVFGAMRDKLLPAMVDELFAITSEVVFTRVDSPRAEEPAHMPRARHAVLADNPRDALSAAQSTAGTDGLVLICGSLALVGLALTELCRGEWQEASTLGQH